MNVASVYSFAPVPFQSVYAACKAFLLSFSASLQNEVSEAGVTVTVFCPGITQTNFRSRAGIIEKRPDSGMTAAEAARIAFRETMRGTHVAIPGDRNRALRIRGSVFAAAVHVGSRAFYQPPARRVKFSGRSINARFSPNQRK